MTQSLPAIIIRRLISHSKILFLILLLLIKVVESPCHANDEPTPNDKPTQTETEPRTLYKEVTPRPHSTIESLRYLGYIYVGTLGVYLYISRDEVFNNVTITNYARNFGNISIFDQDLPTANWIMHVVTGALAYEFYRGRSYTKTDAFFLTLAQECLFQFTVETMIQPTGFENVVNTAVLGTILGRGLELASLPLLNSDFFLFRALGHILNLPTVFGLYEGQVQVYPIINKGATGASVQVHF